MFGICSDFGVESRLLALLGLLSFVASGLSGVLESDLKFVIALSTLSQVALCVLALSYGHFHLAWLHLVTHAVFKSLLFMLVGLVLHSFFSLQDCRFYVLPIRLVLCALGLTVASLMGLAFTSCHLSKEAFLCCYMSLVSVSVAFFLPFLLVGCSCYYSLVLLSRLVLCPFGLQLRFSGVSFHVGCLIPLLYIPFLVGSGVLGGLQLLLVALRASGCLLPFLLALFLPFMLLVSRYSRTYACLVTHLYAGKAHESAL